MSIIKWKSPRSGETIKLKIIKCAHNDCDKCFFSKESYHGIECTPREDRLPVCNTTQYFIEVNDIKDRMKSIKDEKPLLNKQCLIFTTRSGYNVAEFMDNGYWYRKPSHKSDMKIKDEDLWIYIEEL